MQKKDHSWRFLCTYLHNSTHKALESSWPEITWSLYRFVPPPHGPAHAKGRAALSSRNAHTNRLRNVTEPLWLSRWNRASSCSAHHHMRARS